MQFDTTVNNILSEKFGAPTKKARKREVSTSGITSRDPNVWKDPLKKHYMKSTRPDNRKRLGFVPRTHQMNTALPLAQRVLDTAKDADRGIWRISKAQAVALAAKYRMHVPNDENPAKRLGSTGIIMWRKTQGVPEPEMYLVKHDKLLRGALSIKKRNQKITGKKKKGKSVFKGSFKSKYKAKKPKKPVGPMFDPGKVKRTY